VNGEWTGGSVAPWAECVLAGNPGPMTLDGTNSWLLSATGAGQAVVVDPGPADPAHLDALIAAARVRAAGPAWCRGAPPLRDGEVLDAGGLRLEVLLTPGHTADSACFVTGEVLLSGDTVLGRGTSVVAHPDGRLADYLDSLRRLDRLATERRLTQIWPGHGPVLADPVGVLRGYLEHRLARLAQVASALEAGAQDAADVVRLVYADLAAPLRPAAELSVRAQLEYLQTR
jgi:glyoxylase-like metal-dependent hydrolase (beta-lactamase superfamily II)